MYTFSVHTPQSNRTTTGKCLRTASDKDAVSTRVYPVTLNPRGEVSGDVSMEATSRAVTATATPMSTVHWRYLLTWAD